MIAKKSMLSSLCLVFPLLAFTASAGVDSQTTPDSMMSLDELRDKCLEYANNGQYREFNMKLECSGKYSYSVEEKRTISLENQSRMDVQTTTKNGDYQTEGKVFSRASDPFQTSCSIWTKKVMTAPEGMGLPVTISSCDQLTTEYVQKRCAEEIVDYCNDNVVTAQQSKGETLKDSSVSSSDQNAAAGMCVLSSEEVVDTCVLYTHDTTKGQSEAPQSGTSGK